MYQPSPPLSSPLYTDNSKVPSLIPPILTCLIGKRLGDTTTPVNIQFTLRDLAASILKLVCKKFGDSSHTLKPRLTRTCLKHFLDPVKPFGTHYGSIIGLAAIGGRECTRVLILPNIKLFEKVVRPEIEEDGPRRKEAEMCVSAIVGVLKLLEEDFQYPLNPPVGSADEIRSQLIHHVGEIVGDEVWRLRREPLVRSILEAAAAGV